MLLRNSCLILVFSLLLCAPLQAAEFATVAGKVTVGAEKTPVAGVRILAYPLEVMHLQGEPEFASEPTGEDGLFKFQLPPGGYYFIAEGKELYSYYGRNPVTVPPGGVEGMNLSLLQRSPQPKAAEPLIDTGILGHVSANGKPVAGVVISVYTDLTTQLKGQGLGMTAPTDENGRFEAMVQPGTYYLVARKRQSGSYMGPLQAGDYFGYYPENPVRISEGQVLRVPIALIEVPEKVSRLAENLFGETSIRGRVVDIDGQPVAGVRVLLYGDPMMLNRPLFISQPTAADGRYLVSFPEGGTYWLAARNQIGGPPVPGELYGRFHGSRDGSIQLKTGQDLTEVTLTVEEMR